MDEAERIHAMRREGRLTPAEADRLLQALGELRREQDEAVDSGQAQDGSAAAPNEARVDGATPHASDAGTAATQPSGAHARTAATAGESAAPGVRTWLRVEAFATQLRVEGVAGLEAPEARIDGEAIAVDRVDDGFRIRQPHEANGPENWIDRLVRGLKSRTLDVRVPVDCGVHLATRAGEVRLREVIAVRGRLTVGDLDARGLRSVDLGLQAGDVDVELDPLPGQHSLRLSVGDLTVRLPRRADVRVHGSVRVGDLDGDPPFAGGRTRGLGVGGTVEGTLGSGRAELALAVVTGDLDVKVV